MVTAPALPFFPFFRFSKHTQLVMCISRGRDDDGENQHAHHTGNGCRRSLTASPLSFVQILALLFAFLLRKEEEGDEGVGIFPG